MAAILLHHSLLQPLTILPLPKHLLLNPQSLVGGTIQQLLGLVPYGLLCRMHQNALNQWPQNRILLLPTLTSLLLLRLVGSLICKLTINPDLFREAIFLLTKCVIRHRYASNLLYFLRFRELCVFNLLDLVS